MLHEHSLHYVAKSCKFDESSEQSGRDKIMFASILSSGENARKPVGFSALETYMQI